MKRGVVLAAAACVLAVGAFLLGHFLAGGGSATPVSRTAMVTATGHAITAHQHPPARIPCAELEDGKVLPFPHGALGNAAETTCTVKPAGPEYLNEWRATAPDGHSAVFQVVKPSRH